VLACPEGEDLVPQFPDLPGVEPGAEPADGLGSAEALRPGTAEEVLDQRWLVLQPRGHEVGVPDLELDSLAPEAFSLDPDLVGEFAPDRCQAGGVYKDTA
jgi:hypothetical protein